MDLPARVNGKTPRWAIEKYPGAEKDFTEWLYSTIFWHMYDEVGEDFDFEQLVRADAEAKQEELLRTIDINSIAERSLVHQWMIAHEEQWFRYLPAEYDTVEELWSGLLDGLVESNSDGKTTAMISDATFFAKTFIPYAKTKGVDAGKLLGLRETWSAARAAVPYLRSALSDSEITEKQREKKVTEILDTLATSGSVRKFKEAMVGKEFKDKGLVQLVGEQYVMHDHTRIVIEAPTQAHVQVIEKKLAGIVTEWRFGTAIDAVKEGISMVSGVET